MSFEENDSFVQALWLKNHLTKAGVLVHVVPATADLTAETARLKAWLAFLAPEISVLSLPSWGDPCKAAPLSPAVLVRRLETLVMCQQKVQRPTVLVMTPDALCQKVPVAVRNVTPLTLSVGQEIELTHMLGMLHRTGGRRGEVVDLPGTYAVRGGLVDIWPAQEPWPVRVVFDGDAIESLRTFDPLSQRTQEKLEQCQWWPTREFLLENPASERLAHALSEPELPSWVPLVWPAFMVPLWEMLGLQGCSMAPGVTSFFENCDEALEQGTQTRLTDEGLPFTGLETFWATTAQRAAFLKKALLRETNEEASKPLGPQLFKKGRSAAQAFEDLHTYQREGPVVCTSASAESLQRWQRFLEMHGTKATVVATHQAVEALPKDVVALARVPSHDNVRLGGIVWLSERACWQQVVPPRTSRRGASKSTRRVMADPTALQVDDLVTHVDHGIGRYKGLQTLEIEGKAHDCLVLLYAGDERLFVPAENMDQILRYGPGDAVVALDRLGSGAWNTRKKRVKKKIEDMSHQLLAAAAERALQKADGLYDAESTAMQRFAAGFPYTLTDDQDTAIQEVLRDLSSETPMDRLVCGDVGFGKTEVALRAAFAMAAMGYQVAVVVPTTLLARQHAAVFAQRFQQVGLKVGHLSRLVSTRAAKQVKQDLASGELRVVVATHAILASDVRFQKLGLLIIDEEQRFGVRHKEQLKKLKTNLHVLTLTATPIPRTLHMALSSLKTLSLIQQPPPGRKAVITHVVSYQASTLCQVLREEKARGGQSFCVCPRIADLNTLEKAITQGVPDIRLGVAHGQMPTAQLERTMTAFEDGQLDVLLATPIIESGIDVHSAGSLVVYRAEMFGLADLYQLRGRVGRNQTQGYAYLMTRWGVDKVEGSAAARRLQVMQSLDYLGAGFAVASHDMDIRGAGNLIGAEQSGQMREVGVAYYQQLLTETVETLRAQQQNRAWQPTFTPMVSYPGAVLFPEMYVGSLEVRLELYRRLSYVSDADDLKAFEEELVDRFGPLPEEVHNLLDVTALKLLCVEAHVARLDVAPKGSLLAFCENTFPNPQGLLSLLQSSRFVARLHQGCKVLLVRTEADWPAHRSVLNNFLRTLGKLAV